MPGHPPQGSSLRGTMPKAHKGFNLQSCLIRTQNPKQEQRNSSDTKYISSDLKTNPASLPTHCVLAKSSFFPALLSNTPAAAPQADVSPLVSTDLVGLAAIWFPFSCCHLRPELIPCMCICSWSLSYTTLLQRLLSRSSAPAIPGGLSGQATAPKPKQTNKAVPKC